MSTATYRWDARQAAADYDAAGPLIHPFYDEVHQAVAAALPFATGDAVRIADLGGGSGRLAERLLERFPHATVTLVEPSAPFQDLARGRLKRFGERAQFVPLRAQQAWSEATGPLDAVVSTSALHHLDGDEKNAVFAAIRAALEPSGVFLNGDEYRPPSDATYLAWLEAWGEHMRSHLAAGSIPATFGDIIDRWEQRNLGDFGGPRSSGDDCHETVEEQTARLYGAGFARVETLWNERLWGVLRAW
jgi:tRNA (cmo5U34)-methyltransferase